MHFLVLFEGCVASIPFVADSASKKLTSGVCRLYEANFAATYFMRSQMCPIHKSVGTRSANELAIAVSLPRHCVSHVWNKSLKNNNKQTKLFLSIDLNYNAFLSLRPEHPPSERSPDRHAGI